jgi:hypothetical protein
LSERGEAHVLWLERGTAPESAEILLKTVTPEGQQSEAVVIAAASAARASGFPRMTAAEGGAVIAWTELSEPSQVRVARVKARK